MPRKKSSSNIGRQFKPGSRKKRSKNLERLNKKQKMDRYLEKFDEIAFEAAEKMAFLSELNREIAEKQSWLERLNDEVVASSEIPPLQGVKLQTPGRGSGFGGEEDRKPETSPDEMSRSVFYRRVSEINEDLIAANGGEEGRDNFVVHSAKALPHNKRLVCNKFIY